MRVEAVAEVAERVPAMVSLAMPRRDTRCPRPATEADSGHTADALCVRCRNSLLCWRSLLPYARPRSFGWMLCRRCGTANQWLLRRGRQCRAGSCGATGFSGRRASSSAGCTPAVPPTAVGGDVSRTRPVCSSIDPHFQPRVRLSLGLPHERGGAPTQPRPRRPPDTPRRRRPTGPPRRSLLARAATSCSGS